MNTFTNLIKSAVVLFIAATIATPSTAQIHFENEGSYELSGIPGNLQCNGKTQLFLFNYYLSNEEENTFKFLDSEFQIEKEFSFKPTPVSKTIVYQERKTDGYTESIDTLEYGYRDQLEPGLSLEAVHSYLDYTLHLECDFESCFISDGLYFVPVEIVGIPTVDYTVEESGFAYYPNNGRVVEARCTRQVKLSDQWETVNEEERVSRYSNIEISSYNNFDNATGCELYISQNFFNDDEKYEFLVPVYARNTEGNIRYTDYLSLHYGEEEYAYEREITYDIYLQGYDVVNEDGNILHTFYVPNDEGMSYCEMFTFNNKNYVCVYRQPYDVHVSYTDIYEINNQTNSIQKVQQLSGISIQPRTPHRNEPIMVELLDKEADKNLEVIVTSANGRVVERTTLRAGNKSLRLNTSRMDAGLYNVTVLKNGQKVENAKVIVR